VGVGAGRGIFGVLPRGDAGRRLSDWLVGSAGLACSLMSIIPVWSMNAGYMLAYQVEHGAGFWLNCTKCNRERRKLHLPHIITKHTPLWSPWGRHPKCEICGNRQFMSGNHSSAGGAMVHPFSCQPGDGDWAQVVQLQRAWKREQDRRHYNRFIDELGHQKPVP
jgi:hypothetical protein